MNIGGKKYECNYEELDFEGTDTANDRSGIRTSGCNKKQPKKK